MTLLIQESQIFIIFEVVMNKKNYIKGCNVSVSLRGQLICI